MEPGMCREGGVPGGQELTKGLDSWGLMVVGSGLGLSPDLAVGALASFAPE